MERETDEVELPPLPIAGFRPTKWAWGAVLWRRVLSLALLLGVALASAAAGLWWLVVIAALAGIALGLATSIPIAGIDLSSLLPARVEGELATILVGAARTANGWTLDVLRVPLLAREGVDPDGHAIGWVVRSVRGPVFLAAAAVVPRALATLAGPERMPTGYFDLLADARIVVRPGATAQTIEVTSDRMRALFARPAMPEGAMQRRDERNVEAWCVGLAEVERSPLTGAERAMLTRRRQVDSSLGVLLAAHATILPASVLLFVLGNVEIVPWQLALVGLGGIALWAPCMGSAQAAFVRLRRAARVRGDLTAGVARVFRGVPAPGPPDDDVTIARAGLAVIASTRSRTLRLASVSRVILAQDERTAARPVAAHVSEVASAPSSIELSVPGLLGRTPGLVVTRRRLTRTELAELARHLRALRPFSLWPTLFILASGALFAAMFERTGWLTIGAWSLCVLGGVGFIARRWRMQERLERDVEQGWLLVVRRPGSSDVVEVLAHLDAVWSDRGVPAAWRRARSPDG